MKNHESAIRKSTNYHNTKQAVIFGQEKNILQSRDRVVAKQLLIPMLGFCVRFHWEKKQCVH